MNYTFSVKAKGRMFGESGLLRSADFGDYSTIKRRAGLQNPQDTFETRPVHAHRE